MNGSRVRNNGPDSGGEETKREAFFGHPGNAARRSGSRRQKTGRHTVAQISRTGGGGGGVDFNYGRRRRDAQVAPVPGPSTPWSPRPLWFPSRPTGDVTLGLLPSSDAVVHRLQPKMPLRKGKKNNKEIASQAPPSCLRFTAIARWINNPFLIIAVSYPVVGGPQIDRRTFSLFHQSSGFIDGVFLVFFFALRYWSIATPREWTRIRTHGTSVPSAIE